ncbi:carboxymuconolactone decarboxylase family protein [Geoalkalibacter sp.]|uniref:carboxymuconolactone decarboxylase family protein n=1 Tax=Geoalkalibacter sp. TaxID=3041440 RepID=UPI00272DF2A0|nr:peroxidase-related enzyme [Geoalkalibacter sp.]
MSRIHSLDPQAAQAGTAEIFAEIKQAFGMVPNLFRAYANHPPLLEANWFKVKKVIMEGVLTRKTKESIAVLVSKDNGCDYCVAAHEAALRSIGVSSEEIRAIETDLQQAEFSRKERALIAFARKANIAPLRIEDNEVKALRDLGADDAEIVEALGVMELFAGFNKFLDALRVEIDF